MNDRRGSPPAIPDVVRTSLVKPASLRISRLLIGSIAWGGIMSASAAVAVWQRGWQNETAILSVAALFALGGLVSYLPAILAAGFVSRRSRSDTRFAAFLVTLAVATIGATALLFAMHYRLYYSSWHEPALTIGWIFQFVFTSAVAIYHFAVLGVRMFLPIGLPALLAVSLWRAVGAR